LENSRKRKFLDKRIKHVNYGIEPKAFNSLTEFEKKSISQRRYIQIFNFALRKDKEKLKNN
jgi:hypothetical protein